MPAVAVVLPTFNRAAWLPEAFAALAEQRFADFRLVIVDDGSTDDTPAVAAKLIADAPFPAELIRQPNAGPGAARQAGIDRLLAADPANQDALRYLAFYDSDDRWLPHHLADCVAALDAHPDVDWVFSSVRVVDAASGRTLVPDVFAPADDAAPPPILACHADDRDGLRVLNDPAAFAALLAGDNLAGFQVSAIRRGVFAGAGANEPPPLRIPPLRVGEDLALTGRALLTGYRLAYLPAVHVEYRVHDDNTSAVDGQAAWPRRRRSLRRYAAALRYLRRSIDPAARPAEHALVTEALADLMFWRLGYHALPLDRRDALRSMRHALSLAPHEPRRWKTYAAARLLPARRAA
ncbi:MAG: glycosyltransferase family 2 protein [Planctomycetota bacterium]